MIRPSTCVSLLILFGTVLAKNQVLQDAPLVTGRLGFSILEQLRRSYCQMFCMAADTASYFMNIMCATKCPELYLPHGTTTTTPAATTSSIATPTSGTMASVAEPTTPSSTTSSAATSTAAAGTTESTISTTTAATSTTTSTTTAMPPVMGPMMPPAGR